MKFTPPPFQPGIPIKSSELFVWREGDIKSIQRAIENSINISIVSERRLGSTSLLLQIANPNGLIVLPEKFICVYVNFQELSIEYTTDDVFNFIGNAIRKKVEKQSDVTFDEHTGWHTLLEQVDNAGWKICLLIDEFDMVLSCPKLGVDFFNSLRSSYNQSLSYLISSHLALNVIEHAVVGKDRIASSFHNIFMTHRLRLFTHSEARTLIKQYFKAGRDDHDSDIAMMLENKLENEMPFILDTTGFHPYLLQVFLYHLCANMESDVWSFDESRDLALADSSRDLESYFQYLWDNNSSPESREIIAKIGDAEIDIDSIDHVYAARLEDRGLVIRDGTHINLFSKLFSAWCLREVNRDKDHVVINRGTMRNQIFISYSHKDSEWLDKLKTHLKPLERNHSISMWDDTKILAGSKWKIEIQNALKTAKVAILLVSPDFLASDFIANHELPHLLNAAEKEGLTIIWIAVRPSLYAKTELAEFQSVNNPSMPLSSLTRSKVDKILVQIAEQVEKAMNS